MAQVDMFSIPRPTEWLDCYSIHTNKHVLIALSTQDDKETRRALLSDIAGMIADSGQWLKVEIIHCDRDGIPRIIGTIHATNKGILVDNQLTS